MGSVWSLVANRSSEVQRKPQGECNKRQRSWLGEEGERRRLIPGLPDELSIGILARVPRIWHSNLKEVCKTWYHVLSDNEIFELRKELRLTEEWLYILVKNREGRLLWYSLDPVSGRWQRLPAMPEVASEEELDQGSASLGLWAAMGSSSIKFAGRVKGWFWRNIGRDRVAFCGCSTGAIDGCLYVLGGFSRDCATRYVWRFDPCKVLWTKVTSMSTARAYCKTGVLNNKLYAVGGVSKAQGAVVPLQSAEVYDPVADFWVQIPSMPFAQVRVLPIALLADVLKPIATGLASVRGRLYVPQSLYSWPFFVDVGGEIFDPATNSWTQMPTGMGEGWPARKAGTKLSAIVNGNLYALDPSSSSTGCEIKMYDHEEDVWKVVMEKVPIVDFTESEFPYLLMGFRGNLNVITKHVNGNVVVLCADMNATAVSSTSSFSSSTPPHTTHSNSNPNAPGWKCIANQNFGSVELVTCQVLDI